MLILLTVLLALPATWSVWTLGGMSLGEALLVLVLLWFVVLLGYPWRPTGKE